MRCWILGEEEDLGMIICVLLCRWDIGGFGYALFYFDFYSSTVFVFLILIVVLKYRMFPVVFGMIEERRLLKLVFVWR